MDEQIDLYHILGLPPRSNIEEIKKSYKALALKYHPDKPGGSVERFQKIKSAYEFLSDPAQKEFYDKTYVGNDQLSSMISSLFDTLVDVMKQKARKKPPPKTTTNSILVIPVKVTLDEIYNCEIKKIVVRLRRGEGWEKVPFYIDLVKHDKGLYIFPGQGDDEYGVKRDIQFKISIQDHAFVKRDTVISCNDLYMEKDMNMYQYYHGIQAKIPFLGSEELDIQTRIPANARHMSDFYTYTHRIEGGGLPYTDETGHVMYGDLYIYFRLRLPESFDELKTIFDV